MSDMVTTTRQTREFTLLLPGTWAMIPMTTPEEIKAATKRMIQKQVPKGDRFAALRLEARREAEKNAMEAFENGAVVYALALELLPGVPFSASLIGLRPGWPDEASPHATVADKLKAVLPNGEDVENPTSLVRRRATHSTQQPGEKPITSLDIEYWLVREDKPPTLFLISVPQIPASDEEIIEFFDAVIGAILWTDDAAAGEPRRSTFA